MNKIECVDYPDNPVEKPLSKPHLTTLIPGMNPYHHAPREKSPTNSRLSTITPTRLTN